MFRGLVLHQIVLLDDIKLLKIHNTQTTLAHLLAPYQMICTTLIIPSLQKISDQNLQSICIETGRCTNNKNRGKALLSIPNQASQQLNLNLSWICTSLPMANPSMM